MEKKKWVEKIFVPQQGKPDKYIFTTEEGRCELLRWLSDGDLGIAPRPLILMKDFNALELLQLYKPLHK